MGDDGAEDEGDNNSYEDQPLDEPDEVDVKDEEMDFLDDQEGRDSRDSTGRSTMIRIDLIRIRDPVSFTYTDPDPDPGL